MPRRDDAPALYPNHSSADELVGRFGLDRVVAELVIRHRPYRGADDLLRLPELCKLISPADLFTLVGQSARTLPQAARLPVAERMTETDERTGLSYGVMVDVAGERRAIIEDSAGNEIASADLAAGAVPIDIASLRLVGYHPYELLRLHPLDRARVRDYLNGPVVAAAGVLWQRVRQQWTRLDAAEAEAIAWLSQLVAGCSDLTRGNGRKRTPPDGSAPTPQETPDVAWWDGAPLAPYDAARGEPARRAAEDRLFERIRKRGGAHHPVTAVQFALVREALTAIEPVAAPAPTTVALPPTVRYDTSDRTAAESEYGRVVVKLVDVSYEGDDIGADWSYAVTVDDCAARVLTAGTHHHGTLRTWDRIVHDHATLDRHGASFPVHLTVTAREHDVMWDDLGSAQVQLLVACDPAYPALEYRAEVTVAVRDRRWYGAGRRTARLRFRFDVETSCV